MREQQARVAGNLRRQSQERKVQLVGHIIGVLDGVVEIVEEEHQAQRQRQAGQDRQHQVAPRHGCERRARLLGVVDHPDVVPAAVGQHLQLFFAEQQGLVQLAVAVGLALEHRVADALAIEVHRGGLLLFERGGERPLLRQRRLIVVPDGFDCLGQLRLQLPRDILEARVDLHDVGILLAIPLHQGGFLALKLGKPGLDRLDVGILQDRGNRVWEPPAPRVVI